MRVVHTTTTADTAAAVPVSLWTHSNTASSVQTCNVQYGTSQPIGANGSYTLALPSANLAYWVVPSELQVRLGARRDHVASEPEPARADLDQQRHQRQRRSSSTTAPRD